ncbi:MAG TPA: hypothetical protein VFT06_14990, partial [Flavisolibacter sp.]|nr:hypothetical protein [Flavisolibacter sp.]
KKVFNCAKKIQGILDANQPFLMCLFFANLEKITAGFVTRFITIAFPTFKSLHTTCTQYEKTHSP